MGNQCCGGKDKDKGEDVKKPSSTERVTISAKEMQTILEKHLGGSRTQYNPILKDSQYTLFSLNTLKRFLAKNRADNIDYTKESFDCDDFADVLMGDVKRWLLSDLKGGHPFGTILGDIRHDINSSKPYPHAMNIFVDNERKVWLIEPQNDRIYTPLPENSAYWYVYL